MSWKDFQKNSPKTKRGIPSDRAKGRLTLALGAAGALVLGVWVFWSHEPPGAETPAQTGDLQKSLFPRVLDLQVLRTNPEEVRVARDGEDFSIELTFDPGLGRFLHETLRRNRVDWGAAAVLDPSTGRVLALASHSEVQPQAPQLALCSTFPAASIFKIVTAAAALEEGVYQRTSTVDFAGGLYSLNRRALARPGGNHMSLSRAFAKSSNAVFGKVGVHEGLGARALAQYAVNFGFNEAIPFDLPVGDSLAEIVAEDTLEVAQIAAGFGEVTLSPLHGALLAAAVANDGRIMEPYVVSRVTDGQGKLRYAAVPRLWKQPIGAVTAREMRRMMWETVSEGTSRRWFRGFRKDKYLAGLVLGGKTGSLTGKNPPGKTEWFVGFARNEQNRELAVGVVMVSREKWRIKPSELAKETFQYYFSPRPVLEANAGGLRIYGP